MAGFFLPVELLYRYSIFEEEQHFYVYVRVCV
jgi:hypothetical protein